MRKKIVLIFLICTFSILIALFSASGLFSVFTYTDTLKSNYDEAVMKEMTLDELIEVVDDRQIFTEEKLDTMMIERASLKKLLKAVKKANTEYIEKTKTIQYRHVYTVSVKNEETGEVTTRRVTRYPTMPIHVTTETYEGKYKLDWQAVYLMCTYKALDLYGGIMEAAANGIVGDLYENVEERKETELSGAANGKEILGSVADIQVPYYDAFVEASNQTGVPLNYLIAVAKQESGLQMLEGDGYKSGIGIMQVTIYAVNEAGFKLEDAKIPEKNILIGAKYLQKYWEKYEKDAVLTYASYNTGVDFSGKKDCIISKYVSRKKYRNETWKGTLRVLSYYTGTDLTEYKDMLRDMYGLDINGIDYIYGDVANGRISLSEEDIEEVIRIMKPFFIYEYDLVNEDKSYYSFQECQMRPHTKMVSGNPGTSSGQITIYTPKSLLEKVELTYVDINMILDDARMNVIGEWYEIRMDRWEGIAAYCWSAYDVEWMGYMIQELPNGQSCIDKFKQYSSIAGWDYEEYKENGGTGGSGNWQGGLDGIASGSYRPLDYVTASIEIPENAGGMSIPLFLQGDSRWGRLSWGSGQTIAAAGCGPTSLSMVLSYLKGICIYPTDVRAWAKPYNPSYMVPGGASTQALFTAGGRAFGVSVRSMPTVNANDIMTALKKGYPVIVSTGAGRDNEFTNGGHFIVLRGLTTDGLVLVNDPNDSQSKKHYLKAYSINTIINNCYWTNGGGLKYGFIFPN